MGLIDIMRRERERGKEIVTKEKKMIEEKEIERELRDGARVREREIREEIRDRARVREREIREEIEREIRDRARVREREISDRARVREREIREEIEREIRDRARVREEREREIRDRARVREREIRDRARVREREIREEIREEVEREIREEIREEIEIEREREIEKRSSILSGCMSTLVQYEGHRHLLQFREIIDLKDQVKCKTCDSNCDSYAFSCLDLLDPNCTFNLHYTCGPLPYTIKHKCHVDSLILTHSLATFEDYQRDDEFYCDACEEQRDPLLPIYQCMECQFATEIKCVISEVISLLAGEHGDVKLRDPIGVLGRVMVQKKLEEQPKPALTTLDGILKSLSKDENNELSSVEKAIEREIATAVEILSDDDDEVLVFSDKAYTKFIKFLDDHSIDNIPIERGEGSNQDFKVSQDWDLEDEVVKVGDYDVIQMMAPILRHLLSKHGDISAESMFSPSVKVFMFNILCACIYDMTNIKVVDITHEWLIKWSAMLKTLERAGFRIQFAVDHLKRLSCAHFGLYVTEQVEKIDRDIDMLEKDLKARKVKRERITSESTKSTFIAECLREASVLKKWKGGIGLL